MISFLARKIHKKKLNIEYIRRLKTNAKYKINKYKLICSPRILNGIHLWARIAGLSGFSAMMMMIRGTE